MGKIVDFLVWVGILNGEDSVFYIGGSDILPPPLKGIDEQQALEGLEQGDEGQKHLEEYRQALADGDRDTLHTLLKEGREIKERTLSGEKSTG